MKKQITTERKKIGYRTIELLAKFGDNDCYSLPALLLRGISVHNATELVDFLKPHLPKLYVTLHHANDCQLHPRLRGWSQKPKIQERSLSDNGGWNHPDWGLNRNIALFEAYLGKSREYWVSDQEKNLALAKRIEKDYQDLFNGLLKSLKPEVFPNNWCSLDISERVKDKKYSELFESARRGDTYLRVDTLIYEIK